MDMVARRKLETAKAKAVAKAMKKVVKLKKSQTKKLKWQRRLGVFMGIAGTCVVAVAAAVMIFPVVDYVKGRIALMKKDYVGADHLFTQCGKFLDSETCRQEALYCYGADCYAAKEYQNAYNAFVECGEYRDCAARVEEMIKMGLAE